jgi:hypothetical protein
MSSNVRKRCAGCRSQVTRDRPLTCTRCKETVYCSSDCQKKDWRLHKPKCTEIREKKTSLARTQESMQSFANTGISDESSDSPAARGPVAQQPAGSEARSVFCSVFTYEAVLERLAVARQKADMRLRDYVPDTQVMGDLCTWATEEFTNGNFGGVTSKERELNQGALAAFRAAWDFQRNRQHKDFAYGSMNIWAILGKCFVKQGDPKAIRYLQRAYDAATWLLDSEADLSSRRELLDVSVHSLAHLVQLVLQYADEQIDPRAYTYKFAVSMLGPMQDLLTGLSNAAARKAQRLRPWIYGLSTMVYLNLGCFAKAKFAHEQQNTAVDDLLNGGRLLVSVADMLRAQQQKERNFWNLVGGKLFLANQEHMQALESLGSVLDLDVADPFIDVEALVISTTIGIQTCYRRTSTDSEHNLFAQACNYITAAQMYLDNHRGVHHRAGMFPPQIDSLQRMIREKGAELHMRKAALLLRYNGNETREDRRAIDQEVCACMDKMRTDMCDAVAAPALRIFVHCAPFMPKMELVSACYTIMGAYMDKFTQIGVNIQTVNLAGTVLVAKSSGCALATLYLSYLRWYQKDKTSFEVLMKYLDQVVTDVLHQTLRDLRCCASCKKTWMKQDQVNFSLCGQCRVFRFCSRACQTNGNKRMHNGGSLLLPPHSRICPLLRHYKLLRKACGDQTATVRGDGSLETLAAAIEELQNEDARVHLQHLQDSMHKFLEHGPLSRPKRIRALHP